MNWIRSFFILCLAVAVVAVGITIPLYNPEQVHLSLLSWRSPSLSLGTLTVIVFSAGCLSGLFINSLWVWRLQAARKRLQKDLNTTLKRAEQLK
mgnify:CR=1 FL=1